METIIETVHGVRGTGTALENALTIMKQHGAKFVDEAIAAHPDGPVQMITEVSRCEVSYEVVVGDPSDSMSPRSARVIWHRLVPFGASDRHCAGGGAFVEMARAQADIAWAALEVLEARR